MTSKGEIGGEGQSGDLTFTTTSVMPAVDGFRVAGVKTASADLAWTTNIPTASVIVYTNLSTGRSLSVGDPTYVVVHAFTVPGLDAGTAYDVLVKAQNEAGAEASSPTLSFKTTVDRVPPVVADVSADSTLYPGAQSKVQTIVSWLTDKPSSSQVFYQEGVAADAKALSTPADANLILKHIVVLTTFKPGAVYKYWVVSRDASGNVSKSETFTVLTPIQKQTVLDLIGKNFQSVFGWTKQVKL